MTAEGPEVLLITEYIEEQLKNKYVVDVIIYDEDTPLGYSKFMDMLPLKVTSVKCKGKFIWVEFEKKFYMFHNIFSSGKWQEEEDGELTRWEIVIKDTKRNKHYKSLYYISKNHLSVIEFSNDYEDLRFHLEHTGPSILDPEFTKVMWKKIIQENQTKNITSILTNQKILSGCGNYIKSEALYYAKISPHKKVSDLTTDEIDKLYEGLIVIPRTSYNKGGYTITDYKGRYGEYEKDLKVYAKRGAKRLKTKDGRYTYWSPRHQN